MTGVGSGPASGDGATRTSRALLVLCAVAVAFAAVDTYVVVLVLPDMMATAQINVSDLQRGAPIISGFLLGYVAMLPLIGRIADVRGPLPVLGASLVVFSVGSLVTAGAYDLTTMVLGRFLQGVGGGGLVPATMALVAATYPVERRGLPLGLVSAVQELGSVLGPLYGALVLAVTTWQGIFAVNVAVGATLALTVRLTGRRAAAPAHGPTSRRTGRPDLLGLAALLVGVVATGIVFEQPASLRDRLTIGRIFIPYVDGGSRWITPVGVVAVLALAGFALRCLLARRPLVDVRGWLGSMVEADLVGALALAAVLAGIVLAFASADPSVSMLSARGPWYLLGSAAAAVAFVAHSRHAPAPLVPRGTLRERPAWGALVVSLLVGWALIAALVDIPLFARTTTEPTQLGAALVLLRFLVALPVGAVVGGVLVRRAPSGVIAGAGMLLSAVAFQLMATWGETSLSHVATTAPLLLGGLGFGLALAPVNAAVLASTSAAAHGVASALVVVARMVGMLVGVSVLTVVGLRHLYAVQAAHPTYSTSRLAVIQEQAVFQGAAVVALAAAALALVLLRGARTRGVTTSELLSAGGRGLPSSDPAIP